MKNLLFIAITLFVGGFTSAQTLQDAITKTENERYDLAAQAFRTLMQNEPAKGDNFFFAGENYMRRGDIDSAIILWKKSYSVEPLNPIAIVGQGKALYYSGDITGAETQFQAALKITKNKNAEIMRQIGSTYTYAPKPNLDGAITILNEAVKIDPKNIDGYLILGDALLEKTPAIGKPAIENYNKALTIDPKSAKAIVRKAKLYQRGQNYEEANKMYKEAQTIDPTYAPAYRENAELNLLFDQSAKAVENWTKYLELNNSTEARYRYATALFSGKKYCEALPVLEGLVGGAFDNFYVKRMLTYSYFECNPNADKALNEKGLVQSNQFFALAPAQKIIAADYRYRGSHLSKIGSDSLAIIELEKAIRIDSAKGRELYGDIGKMYFKAKKYDKSIAAYDQKMNGNPSNLSATEYFEMGRAYYFGPKDYVKADTCFSRVIQRNPEVAPAYLWRARCNFKFDPTNALWQAKPYYEKYTELVLPADRATAQNKNLMLESCKYLGDYYINNKTAKDVAKAKINWAIVQELDPTDKQAKAFFASPEGK